MSIKYTGSIDCNCLKLARKFPRVKNPETIAAQHDLGGPMNRDPCVDPKIEYSLYLGDPKKRPLVFGKTTRLSLEGFTLPQSNVELISKALNPKP